MNQAALKLSVAVLVATTLSSCRRGRDPAAMSLKLVAPAAGATVPATVLVAADVLGGIEPITVTFSAPGSAPVQKGVPPFTELLPLAGETGDLVTLTATAEDVRGARATDSVQVTIDRRLPPDRGVPGSEADAGPPDAGPGGPAPWLGPPSGVEYVIGGAPAPGAQEQPTAIWNGQHTFVAWSDGRDPQRAWVFGARVAGDGSLLDPAGIPLVPGTQPRLGWNGKSHLVVYRERIDETSARLVARRFALDGTALAGEPAVLTTKPSALVPSAVASNGDGFLVVWVDHRNELSDRWARLYAARVDASGRLLDPQGVRLTKDDYEPDGLSDLSVSWNGQNYLVSFVGPWGVMAMAIAPDGRLLSGPSQVPDWPGRHRHPAFAFDGTDHLAVWEQTDVPNDSHTLWAAHVNPALGARDAPGFSIDPMSGDRVLTWPRLAWMGTHYVLVWNELDQTRSARLSAAGALLDPAGFAGPRQAGPSSVLVAGDKELLFVASSADAPPDVVGWRVQPSARFVEGDPLRISASAVAQWKGALGWNGTRFLAVWLDYYFSDPILKGQLLDEAGRNLSSEAWGITQDIVRTTPPVMTSNGKDFLVIWEDPSAGGDIRADIVAGDGSTAGAKGIVVSKAPDRQTSPAVVWTGAHFLVAWIDSRNGAGDARSVYGARITSGGVNLDPDGIRLGDTTGASSVSVAGGSGGLLLVWQEGAVGRLRAQALSMDGVAQGKPFAVADTNHRQESPTVAWNGIDYLVAWSEWRDDVQADLYGARVSARAEVLRDGSGGFAICRAPQGQGAARATWNGTNFVVAWRDERKSTKATTLMDVYAARVSPAGRVLDPDGFAVAATDEYEDAPALAGRGDGAALVMWQHYDPTPTVRSVRVSMRMTAETAKDDVTPRNDNEPCAADWHCRSGVCAGGACCSTCGGAADAGP